MSVTRNLKALVQQRIARDPAFVAAPPGDEHERFMFALHNPFDQASA